MYVLPIPYQATYRNETILMLAKLNYDVRGERTIRLFLNRRTLPLRPVGYSPALEARPGPAELVWPLITILVMCKCTNMQCTNKNNNNVYTNSFKIASFPKKKPLFTTQVKIASAILTIQTITSLIGWLMLGTVSQTMLYYLGKSAQFELPRKFTKLTYNDSISDY